jgi:spermidine synthase
LPTRFDRARLELLGMAFCSGGAVMVVEILGTRIIGPVFGVGLFVWSALLTVTLASLAVGYYLGGVLADRRPDVRVLSWVLAIGGALLGLLPLERPVVLRLTEDLGPRLGSLLSAGILFAPSLAVLGMVGPIAVRVATAQIEDTGHRVGAVYAVSTAGSLIGTLLASFVLIPNFDTGQILLGTALLLTLLGVAGLARARRSALLLLLLVPLASLGSSTPELPIGLTILERAQSPYSLLEVIEDANRDVRMLRSDHSIIGAQLRGDGSAAFAFLHLLEAIRFARPEAKEMLQIGVGIGSLAMALKPFGIETDAVEIDPEVLRLAHKHFGFSAARREFSEDARGFLNRSKHKYDIIVHDAFTGGGTPEHLLSREVVARIRALLRPDGVLALNFVGYEHGPNAEASWSVMRTLRSVFPVVRAFRDGPAEEENSLSNLVFFASGRALSFEIPRAAQFENDACAEVLRQFQRWEVLETVPAGPIITDAHNALARLQLPIAEEHFWDMRKLLPPEVWIR